MHISPTPDFTLASLLLFALLGTIFHVHVCIIATNVSNVVISFYHRVL